MDGYVEVEFRGVRYATRVRNDAIEKVGLVTEDQLNFKPHKQKIKRVEACGPAHAPVIVELDEGTLEIEVGQYVVREPATGQLMSLDCDTFKRCYKRLKEKSDE